jgi:methionyl-tRNA formyltransferase
MKLIFAGTPPFAAAALRALHAAGHEIVLVLTQPDRPAGRGLKLSASAVAETATALGLHLEKPDSLSGSAIQQQLVDCNADVMVVAAYGLLLPQRILDIPARGCLNIHASLLPRWRGAAPIQRAIEAGDTETGVCIMQMEAGLDTGSVLLAQPIQIAATDTSASMFERLSALGAQAIVDSLAALPSLAPTPQDATLATYAKKIQKSEARISWAEHAHLLERRMRAFDPFPGCETLIGGERVKFWRAEVVKAGANGSVAAPGTIVRADRDKLLVATGEKTLRILTAQRAGGKRISASELVAALNLQVGQQCQ